MKQKYVVDVFDPKGFDELLSAVESYSKRMNDKAAELIRRLADEGYLIASSGFAMSQYDGSYDVTVRVEERNDKCVALVAVGATALFIEFGTGVTYPDDHPEAGNLGMVRGAYGKGRGSKPTWGYYGDPGTNGEVKVKGDGKQVVLTHGNPANKPMYNTVKELETRLSALAQEVFGSD